MRFLKGQCNTQAAWPFQDPPCPVLNQINESLALAGSVILFTPLPFGCMNVSLQNLNDNSIGITRNLFHCNISLHSHFDKRRPSKVYLIPVLVLQYFRNAKSKVIAFRSQPERGTSAFARKVTTLLATPPGQLATRHNL